MIFYFSTISSAQRIVGQRETKIFMKNFKNVEIRVEQAKERLPCDVMLLLLERSGNKKIPIASTNLLGECCKP